MWRKTHPALWGGWDVRLWGFSLVIKCANRGFSGQRVTYEAEETTSLLRGDAGGNEIIH
jgi:hypothetical protein